MRPTPDRAIAFIKEREALRLRAYKDSVGVWTCGWGSTRGVHGGTEWTRKEAEAALAADLREAGERLERKVGVAAVARLNDCQYAAMLSFVFNLGTPGTTIWALLKKGALEGVPAQILRFNKARDPDTGELRVLKGLNNRRLLEVALWHDADDQKSPPSSVTRFVDTPPAELPQKPLASSRSFMTVAGAAVLGAPAAFKQVSDTVAPFADKSHLVEQVVGWLATGSAAAAAAGLALMWLKSRRAARG